MAKARWRFDVPTALLTLAVAGAGAFGYRAVAHRPAARKTVQQRIADDIHRIGALKIDVVGKLTNPTGRSIAVGRTREDYLALAEAEDAGDEVGVQEVVLSDRGFRVPSGSEATLVEKTEFGVLKVRFTGGDFADETAWCSGEYFH